MEDDKNKIAINSVGEYVLLGEEGTCLPKLFQNYIDDVEHFKIRSTDVIIASFPRSGTTWTQEMVWLVANNLDYEGAQVNIQQRFPLLEICTVLEDQCYSPQFTAEWLSNSIEYTNQLPDQRYIKTHLPFSLLPKDIRSGLKSSKIIYVMRNSKDVCVSYYHQYKLFTNCTVSLDGFAKVFLTDRVIYGSYWKHVFGYYNKRSLPNVHIVKYEDLKNNLESVIRQVCTFLEKDQLTKEEMQTLCNHLQFSRMKNNDSVNYSCNIAPEKRDDPEFQGSFIRCGQVGSYKEEMSSDMITKFDEWIIENVANTDLDVNYACNI